MKRHRLILAAAAVLVGPLLIEATPSAARPVAPMCQGRQATIVSSASAIEGTAQDDVIVVAGPGTHRVDAGAGDDLVCGSPSSDILQGGPGADRLVGGRGADELFGGGGPDILRGGTGDDGIAGGRGGDALGGDAGQDQLRGGVGENTCAPGDQDRSGCSLDASGPAVLEVGGPSEASPGEEVTFSWRARDAAGVASADLRIGGYQGLAGWCFAAPATLVEGDDHDGTWSVTCRVPINSINDDLGIEVWAIDALGQVSKTAASRGLQIAGGSDDFAAPAVSEINAPVSVERGQPLTVSMRLQDSTGIGFASVLLRAAPQFYFELRSTLVSGDQQDGTWEVTLDVPADAAPGDYSLWVWLGDLVNNRVVLDAGVVTVTG